jgi:hypothetical protein
MSLGGWISAIPNGRRSPVKAEWRPALRVGLGELEGALPSHSRQESHALAVNRVDCRQYSGRGAQHDALCQLPRRVIRFQGVRA